MRTIRTIIRSIPYLMFVLGLLLMGYLLTMESIADEKKKDETLKTEVVELAEEKESLIKEIEDIKVANGLAEYIVTLEIRQTHVTLDIGQMIADDMNALTIQIPVDKEYYNSVEIGDKIANDFRTGSFVIKGSVGNWSVKVIDKTIQ